ncbi:MAG: alpha/beta hydrolase [Acidobacteriaceae bacterium]|nr:alpha/beta hydrolase [Acidobacteriaceae bacterium]
MTGVRDPRTDIRNPELQRLLSEMDERGGLASSTIEEKRNAYRVAVERSGEPEPIHFEDWTLPGPAGDIPIRIYRPKFEGAGAPVLLYIHGGGFVSGDLDTHDPVCRILANHIPAIVVAVDYRLAPEYPYPAAAADCFAVLRWLASNAESIGGDSAQIAVAGDSAGGNLAAVVALMAREKEEISLKAQVLIYPMLDATLSSASLVENAFIPPFTLVDCVYSWQLYLPKDVDRRNPFVSPVQAQMLTGTAPALVLTAEYDILADEGETYVQRLREAGVRVEHEEYQGMIHGFFQWGGVVAGARLAMNRVVQFLQRELSTLNEQAARA